MVEITASEASRNFSTLLDRAAAGESFLVMRGGKRVAEIRPAGDANAGALRDLIAGMSDEERALFDDEFAARVRGIRDWSRGVPWRA